MLINYKCEKCGNSIQKIVQHEGEILGVLPCGECSGFLERVIGGASSNSTEIIDNGFMPTKVEYDATRASLRKEASTEYFLNKTGKKLN